MKYGHGPKFLHALLPYTPPLKLQYLPTLKSETA